MIIKVIEIENKINYTEKWLLDNSILIKKSVENFGDLYSWILHIIENDSEVLELFQIPTDLASRQAILKLLKTKEYKRPLFRLFVNRIISYSTSAIHLITRTKNKEILKQIGYNFNKLITLIKEYESEKGKLLTAEKINKATKHNRLHGFKTYANESDLRIILKTLEKEVDDSEELHSLLDNLYNILIINKKNFKALADSRHIWWAIKILLSYNDYTWVENNISNIQKLLENLLQLEVFISENYRSNDDIFEKYVLYYERVWVLENSINILKIIKDRYKNLFDNKIINELIKFTRQNIKEYFQASNRNENLRNCQCDLIILYELKDHHNLVYTDDKSLTAIKDIIKKDDTFTDEDVLKSLKIKKS